MAKGKKTGGRQFKPGESGNPNGRPQLPGDIKAARVLNQIELERILNELLYEMEAGSLDEVLTDPTRKPVEQILAKIILESIERGDAIRLDFLLNRIIGKVKDKSEVKVTGSVHGQIVALINKYNESNDTD